MRRLPQVSSSMGKRKALSAAEKREIVHCLRQGMEILDISTKTYAMCDRRTVNKFAADPEHRWVRADKDTIIHISVRLCNSNVCFVLFCEGLERP